MSSVFPGTTSIASDLQTIEKKPPQKPNVNPATNPQAAGPVLPSPPHPVLQAAGFNHGGIDEFNKRVQAVTDAHRQAHGTTPPAGLALDVVRSPVQPKDYPNLFNPAFGDQRSSSALGAVNQHKAANPDDYFVTRPDGVIQPNNVFYRMSQQVSGQQVAKPEEPQQEFLKQHPMVTMGVLPIPSAGKIENALAVLNSPLPQVNKPTGHQAPGSFAEQQAEFQAQGRANALTAEAGSVKTLRQAQIELNTAMGTNLPVSGVFNQTWTTALSNWMKTTDYAKKELAYQAQQDGFGNNVAGYEKAWHQKQRASSHGLYGWFLNSMPLALFGHGSVWDDLASTPGYLKGSSNNPLNIGLHSLTKSAGLGLDTLGGTVTQAKADLAAGTQFAADMYSLNGKQFTYEEALQDARKRLHEQPSWLRIFTPGVDPANEPKWFKTLDQITNVAGDLILLRKPAMTGERVAAGDVSAASSSAYLRASSDWAYNSLLKYGQDGIGRASARLESGQGARALVSRLAKSVQSGDITREQFRQYVSELYANGHTKIRFRVSEVPKKPVTEKAIPPDTRPRPWDGLKPGDTFTFKNSRGEEETGFLDPKGVPRNSDGAKLADTRNLDVNKLKQDIKDALASGEYEYTGPLSDRDMADLYPDDTGRVKSSIREVEVRGPLLNSLRSNKLPTPGAPGRAWMQFKDGVRNWADRFDQSSSPLATDRAKGFVNTLRAATSHYVPPTLGYMDEILPERVYNFVIKNKLGEDAPGLANRLESILVKAQGTENVTRIQQVEQTLQKLYYDKNKLGVAPNENPFKAVLSTEAPSVFHFPGGGEPELEKGFSAIEGNAAKVNATLNKVAKLHARVILSGVNLATGLGGFSLFWKHAIGDSLRVEAGGGGIITGLDGEVRAAKAEINNLAASNPELSRMLGAFRERAVKSEANWVLNRTAAFQRDFKTSEHFGQGNYMAAAGGYLRRHLDDPALQAYQSGGDALTQLILHDRTYRGMWKAAKQKTPDLTAEQYADMVAERYQGIQSALAAQGLSFDDASTFYNSVRGAKADAELGKWIKKNGLDFDVHSGLVEQVGTFDHLTGWWVGNVIMKPNKLNRGRFAENVLARNYADLKKAGWKPADALQTATSVAGNLTKYHMLDFANRLQVEQDLRWLSYFATKHRLYWKWVLGTFARNPGYAAAVNDFAQTLNQSGGWTLPFTAFGQKWMVPLERLVWVPGREYDETSPLALAVFNFIKSGGNLDQVVKGAAGTNGNIITRSDTAVVLGTKLLKIETGGAVPTYGYATAGLDKKTQGYVTKALNEYQVTYQLQHGHYDTEANAVKKVLLSQAGEEYWRANLPLPIVPEQDRSEQQQLLSEFMQLDDPRARAKFMQKHPGFSDQFGVYDNPKSNLHNRLYFQRWTKALDAYRSARAALYDQARKTGTWTTEMEAQRRELNDSLNKTRNQLLIDDAQQAGVNTRGLVPNGTTVPYGPWGNLVNKDPQFDTTHALNTLFPKLAGTVTDNVIGPMQKQMQAELTQLNDPKYVQASGYTPEEVKTRRGELIQKLEVFKSYPSDALGALHDNYQTKVNQFWKGYNQRYNAAQSAPSQERPALDASFRAWRDDQDHPVTIDGVTFPSAVRMAWAMLDPKTRQQRLSYLASKPLADLANYELDLLGVKHPAYVSNALSAIETAVTAAREKGQRIEASQVAAVAKQVDKTPGYHGFYSYYVNTLTEPRVRQFEQTTIYQGMPSDVRTGFDQIGSAAIAFTREEKKNGNPSYYGSKWRQIVKEDITPWLQLPDNKPLREYLAPMGPNFLYTLVESSRVG